MLDEPEVREIAYMWEKDKSEGKALIRVDITETTSWRNALQHLSLQLNHTMKPNMKQATDNALKAGEIEYSESFLGSKEIGASTFTIGNLKVVVSSVGSESIDISKYAKQISGVLSKPEDVKSKSSELSQHLESELSSVKKNEHMMLVEKLPEANTRGEWVKTIVEDGELYREGSALKYICDKDGTKKVHVIKTLQK
jgi:hypothetical protein